MNIPSFKENHISQIPALQILIKLGYTYISASEVDQLRGGKTSIVLLEDILRKQLKEINSIKVSSQKTTLFTDDNIEKGILALKTIPMNEGYIAACEKAYNMLTLGHELEQSIDGDKKSFTLKYIDWKNLENNVLHVTEEYAVMRSTNKEHYRPDIVLFINGIPICIIECKKPGKDAIPQAISQTLRNQQDDGIRQLYIYSQLLLCISSNDAVYGSNDTKPEFFSRWKEKFLYSDDEAGYQNKLKYLKNTSLPPSQNDKLFSAKYNYVKNYFKAIEDEEIQVTVQDEYLYNLCRPERLFDIMFNFILFENDVKKIARYQQFFAIKKMMQRIRTKEHGKRKGGVIWHTQGSGKSLTMVMLAKAIAMDPNIVNPKIVLVTDRTDLDKQITDTFKSCDMQVENAVTGQKLVELLESKRDAVITTIINKFNAAVKKIKAPLESSEIFVLVDEGHRTQHGVFNIDMQKTLPNACFIAMTGTPLFKKEKSTAEKFGGIVDAYTVKEAVEDKTVVPLLYEGRVALQNVHGDSIDKYFDYISEPLTDYQKADLKKKYSRADLLNSAEQKIYAIAWDISKHFKDNWQGTPFKAQLVCDKKLSAIKYKEFLDEIGIVSSEVLISGVDDREGEETAYDQSPEKVKKFWKKMMDEHGNAKTYEKNIINRFKKQSHPEIIIVVDKLLTGFDEPKNTVLYLTRNLSDHKLLQAIARVNRVYSYKEFGYIIDYYGVIENLDNAMYMYSTFENFDEQDLEGTLINVDEEIKKLPQKHSELWDIFKTIPNKKDAEAYQMLLRDEVTRLVFYEKLTSFGTSLKIALSTINFYKMVDEKIINKYKQDFKMFLDLRKAVKERYSDAIDFKKYESQIQKLIDTHITTDKVESITELVNIFDKDEFQKEIEKTVGLAAKADKIASRTSKYLSEKMDEDPAFYKKLSQLLKEAIADYEAKRISEVQYLKRTEEIMKNALLKNNSALPQELVNNELAGALYGIIIETIASKFENSELGKNACKDIALYLDKMILESIMENNKPIIDWYYKSNIKGKLAIDIGDYFIDEVRDKYQISFSFEEMDNLTDLCLNIAKARF